MRSFLYLIQNFILIAFPKLFLCNQGEHARDCVKKRVKIRRKNLFLMLKFSIEDEKRTCPSSVKWQEDWFGTREEGDKQLRGRRRRWEDIGPNQREVRDSWEVERVLLLIMRVYQISLTQSKNSFVCGLPKVVLGSGRVGLTCPSCTLVYYVFWSHLGG